MHGQLGTGYIGDPDEKERPEDSVVFPTEALLPGKVVAISCGEKHTVAVTSDGGACQLLTCVCVC